MVKACRFFKAVIKNITKGRGRQVLEARYGGSKVLAEGRC